MKANVSFERMEVHPLSAFFPKIEGEEFEAFVADIEKHGQRDPIITYQGKILDGRNRYRACLQLDITPKYKSFNGTPQEVADYVISVNAQRRHLTPTQKAMCVATCQDWAKAQTVGRPNKCVPENTFPENKCVPENTLSDTITSRAKKAGVSKMTQRRADTVAKADPELAKKVISGEVSLQSAVAKVAPQLVSKPKKKEVPRQSMVDEFKEEEEAELHNTILTLAEEVEQLKDIIAVGNLPEPERTAGDTIKELREQIKTLEATLKSVTTSRDSLMNENAALKRQCNSYIAKLKKLEQKNA